MTISSLSSAISVLRSSTIWSFISVSLSQICCDSLNSFLCYLSWSSRSFCFVKSIVLMSEISVVFPLDSYPISFMWSFITWSFSAMTPSSLKMDSWYKSLMSSMLSISLSNCKAWCLYANKSLEMCFICSSIWYPCTRSKCLYVNSRFSILSVVFLIASDTSYPIMLLFFIFDTTYKSSSYCWAVTGDLIIRDYFISLISSSFFRPSESSIVTFLLFEFLVLSILKLFPRGGFKPFSLFLVYLMLSSVPYLL